MQPSQYGPVDWGSSHEGHLVAGFIFDLGCSFVLPLIADRVGEGPCAQVVTVRLIAVALPVSGCCKWRVLKEIGRLLGDVVNARVARVTGWLRARQLLLGRFLLDQWLLDLRSAEHSQCC